MWLKGIVEPFGGPTVEAGKRRVHEHAPYRAKAALVTVGAAGRRPICVSGLRAKELRRREKVAVLSVVLEYFPSMTAIGHEQTRMAI